MANDLVLLTGATGYLGYLTLIALLKRGYKVRAAVRSNSKVSKIEAAPSFKALKPSVEWVIVPDMTADGAYDEAVKGVKYIVHVASPIPTFGTEAIPTEKLEEYFLHQAPKGELGMLTSAHKAGTVKRIVVTSSVVAIVPFEYYMGEGDYSKVIPASNRIPDVTGPFVAEFQAYSAGKAKAINASEAWMESHDTIFDLISVIPGWIFGQDELVSSVEDFTKGSTNSVLLNLLLGNKEENGYNGNVVSGEDVAQLQVLALDPSIKGNQSFIASIDAEWEDAIAIVKKEYPEQVANGDFSVDGKQPTFDIKHTWKETEATFAPLGFKFAPFEKIVKAVAKQYLELKAKA
ncbi:NAD(P)-binding protein [Microthyrium microscopicum]|uniref:NAD(P)-binding protein n=1 Tax=Microthyrium microscopicum TaxID=703497 RepID=A0A6A6U0F2_9PEZI|nr:NAD(P)-binding protein [Microthyrium microscopicum]